MEVNAYLNDIRVQGGFGLICQLLAYFPKCVWPVLVPTFICVGVIPFRPTIIHTRVPNYVSIILLATVPLNFYLAHGYDTEWSSAYDRLQVEQITMASILYCTGPLVPNLHFDSRALGAIRTLWDGIDAIFGEFGPIAQASAWLVTNKMADYIVYRRLFDHLNGCITLLVLGYVWRVVAFCVAMSIRAIERRRQRERALWMHQQNLDGLNRMM
ncbi:Fc.00g062450.m01.CDS01 [Cosmosporella sp. VM-42]